MTRRLPSIIAALLLTTGCATGPRATSPPPPMIGASQSSPPVDLAGYQTADFRDADSTDVVQPASVAVADLAASDAPASEEPALVELPEPNRALPDALTLESLETIALANNPAIARAAAQVDALRGKWVQVGLPPNPTVGYVGSEIGNDGAAGQQGGFVGQEFVTANKLACNRAVVAAEIQRAEQDLAAMQRRVQTDVGLAFYGALIAQRRVELAEELVRVATSATNASKSLLDAEEIPLAGLLQTEIQRQNAEVILRTAENQYEQSWRRLAATIGSPDMAIQPIAGDPTALPNDVGWEAQFARLRTLSPEIASAMAEVERARRALCRACIDPVPNITTQMSVQFDDATNDTVAGVQVGLPLPIWNRNQGGICQAQAQVRAAARNVDRLELDLARRLAVAYQNYASARLTVDSYSAEILPRAARTLELVRRGYEEGEVGYLDLLAAQRTFSRTNLDYLDALRQLWTNYVQIDGLLLSGSLD